jgi:hypothetical protein
MKTLTILFAALVPVALGAQTPGGTPFRVERLDPALT